MSDILSDSDTFQEISPERVCAVSDAYKSSLRLLRRNECITPDQFQQFTSNLSRPVYNTKITTKEAGKVMETCKYCGKQLEYKSQLIVHEKTHTGKGSLCVMERSNRKFNVAQHKITHTEEKPFTCDHCPYRSAHKTNFKVHMRKHTDSKPYICDLCGFQTSYSGSLNGHKRNKHTDPALKCKLCKYVARGKADLRSHACKESLCCGECGYRSQSRSHFIRHQEVHNSVLTPAPSVERRVSPRLTSPHI
ncbi:ZNF334 [Cordylochernes scorpioides]|uniref:ZNF334 n=1 Tax=Cordylochernes scorpioides TaxID=51811 RepID=A0ABY6KDL0_9ARAC|nr:ZNF334 [Cordylochernes scorpioides]